MKLPSVKDLASLVKAIKPTIANDYHASDDPGDNTPAILLTVGADGTGGWDYQTGNNSYSGGAYMYPAWGVVTIERRSNSREIAKELREQLTEALSY